MSKKDKEQPETPEQQLEAGKSLKEMIAEGVTEAMKQVIPAMMLANRQMEAESKKQAKADREKELEAQIREEMSKLEVCSVCRQKVKACGGSVKDQRGNEIDAFRHPDGVEVIVKGEDGKERVELRHGNHGRMYVNVANRRRAKWFPGVWINGVQYLSVTTQHLMWVPKDNEIGAKIADWAESDEELRTKREIEHDSGIITPSSTRKFQAFSGPGFRTLEQT